MDFNKYLETKLTTNYAGGLDLIKTRLEQLNIIPKRIQTNLTKTLLDDVRAYLSSDAIKLTDPDLASKIMDYLCQLPGCPAEFITWLSAINPGTLAISSIQQAFIYLIKTTREYCTLTGDGNSLTLYNNIKCWIFSVFTLSIAKVIFSQPTLAINPDYLFFISGSYSLVDILVDSGSVSSNNITGLLDQIKQLLSLNPQKTSSKTPATFLYNKLIASGYTPEKIASAKYCLKTEAECHKLQRNPAVSLARHELIQLTIDKGVSTGNLITAAYSLDLELPSQYPNTALEHPANLFKLYSVLMQLLDDLADYKEDNLAGINTAVQAYDQGSYAGYAVCVLDILLDFLAGCEKSGLFDKSQLQGLKTGLANFWCYCVTRNHEFIEAEPELCGLIQDIYLFDPEYIRELRAEKHKKKAGLCTWAEELG